MGAHVQGLTHGGRMPRLSAAEAEMVAENLGLVGWVLQRDRVRPDEYEDRYQDGVIGLMRAVQKFEPERGFRFSTYATFWIRQGIHRGRATAEGANYRRDTGFAGDPRYPGRPGGYRRPVSLDAPRGDDDWSILDTLAAPDDAEAWAVEGVAAGELVAQICRHAHTEMERRVVERRAAGVTYREIGEELGLSTEAVRQAVMRIRRRRDRLAVGVA